AMYRTPEAKRWSAQHVATQRVLPALIEVETGFKGVSPVWPSRPCTSGDPYRSRLLESCRTALGNHEAGRATLMDRLYILICRELDRLTATDPTYEPYRVLVDRYNANHPDEDPVVRLHVPAVAFNGPGWVRRTVSDE
ncbi:hypothetical protein ACFQ1S_07700, partial [Kibdelosporangium lantanae]